MRILTFIEFAANVVLFLCWRLKIWFFGFPKSKVRVQWTVRIQQKVVDSGRRVRILQLIVFYGFIFSSVPHLLLIWIVWKNLSYLLPNWVMFLPAYWFANSDAANVHVGFRANGRDMCSSIEYCSIWTCEIIKMCVSMIIGFQV